MIKYWQGCSSKITIRSMKARSDITLESFFFFWLKFFYLLLLTTLNSYLTFYANFLLTYTSIISFLACLFLLCEQIYKKKPPWELDKLLSFNILKHNNEGYATIILNNFSRRPNFTHNYDFIIPVEFSSDLETTLIQSQC